MKLNLHTITRGLAAWAMAAMTATAGAQSWSFGSVSDSDIANLSADTEAWTYESSNNRYKNATNYDAEPLAANGQTLQLTSGLLFTITASDAVRIDIKNNRIGLNKQQTITIPNVAAGSTITVSCKSSSGSAARGINVTNVEPTSGYFNQTTTADQTNVGTVIADGDVTLANTGGLYLYSIAIGAPGAGGQTGGGDTGGSTDDIPSEHNKAFDPMQRQMQLTLVNNEVRYYNTDQLDNVTIDREQGIVSVWPAQTDGHDEYAQTVRSIGFTKPQAQGGEANIDNGGVQITRAGGWLETAYAEWTVSADADSYNVYVKGGPYDDFTRIDDELVRNYGSHGRADMVGLPAAADYALRVVPVSGGVEQAELASTASGIAVAAHQRTGFAFSGYSGIGAYADDGTLKSDARVIYVTAQTAKTVTLGVVTGSKGQEETLTGLQSILAAYEKGRETRPLCVRIIGTITDSDMDKLGSSAEGLQIKGKNNSTAMNITIEGIGNDAAIWGFGILIRNALGVELRNFAIMLCMDDCVSLDTNNKHCWIHHLDLFYGKTGGDSDQAKGDGTIDIKGKSTNITVAYNHFWDSGKSSLCGMKSETTDCLIDYHHNWFDHSDSRHPRVRTMTVHVWNNYYDGCAKYGVGATMGSSVFVENNFFRASKYPMLISKQGTDAKGSGTFSGEDGGMIKSFGNVYAEATGSSYLPTTHATTATNFDCYEAATRDEQVPASYTTLAGGTTYNNFDTDPSVIHDYTPSTADEVPAIVTGHYGAGRMDKGDFKWTFNNATDDANYDVDTAMKTALEQYRSTLVGHF